MAAWVYNDAQANGLTKLKPYNSGVAALAGQGNCVSVLEYPAEVKTVSFRGPAGAWSSQRVSGLNQVTIPWEWTIVGNNEADLLTVIRSIKAYLKDGRPYTLSDGTRSNDYVVIDAAQTRPISKFRKLSEGRYRQVWLVTFNVLRPEMSATKF